jgi:hypothetical protein
MAELMQLKPLPRCSTGETVKVLYPYDAQLKDELTLS